MIYEAKRGPYAVLVGGVGVLFLFEGVFLMFNAPLFGVIPLVIAVYLLWTVFSTSYEITAETLLIRSGPVRYRIPIKQIIDVSPERRVLRPLRPAGAFFLSMDRLVVRRRKANGSEAPFVIHISPREKEDFLRELVHVMPTSAAEDAT